jgi:hypothetical protein
MILIVTVGLLVLLWIVDAAFNFFPVPRVTFYQYITLILIAIVQPLVIYTTILKNYHSSSHLKEPLEIEFTHSQVKITGKSFYTEFDWGKTFKIVELKKWFIIYESNLTAVIIPKKSFSKTQEEEFRKIVTSIKKVPVLLKD